LKGKIQMGGSGVDLRMKLLKEAADQQLIKPFRTHGWSATVGSVNSSGEYLIVEATKSGVTRRVGLLYSSATDNCHYKALDATVDHIFTNGALYQIDSFAYGITKPVAPVGEFFPVLVAWNKELAPVLEKPLPPTGPHTVRIITAENPLTGIWSRLDQFASVTLAEKLVARRATERSVELTPEAIKSKAAGLAFTIRNASDYFRDTPFESLNKRILSLYYGALALASAEMMASPVGPTDLDEVEGITKQGHGLYTVPSATGDFGGLSLGVLATGFFPRWVSFLGHDTSQYPRAKAKTSSDLEKQPHGQNQQTGSTYIHLLDQSGRIQEESLKSAGWPLAEITSIAATGSGRSFRARVDHPGRGFWFEALMLHRSPFKEGPTLIMPVFGDVSEHRIISVVTLYALSILVRYMPSSWRRIEGGDWDEHLALVKNAVGVFERLLPEQFLESIINERINAKQPGGF
jgi:hypothetical protein